VLIGGEQERDEDHFLVAKACEPFFRGWPERAASH
jgi:hypothetical protein